jgi:hypothetical protein
VLLPQIRPDGGNDTAYTALPLPPHNDGCYMRDQPGFQMFHCLQPAASGGDSTLVDGVALAARLGRRNLESLQYLANPFNRIVYHHTDEKDIFLQSRPVFSRFSPSTSLLSGVEEIARVHFNDIDRAPLSSINAPPSALGPHMLSFYSHWLNLMHVLTEPELELRLGLRPGYVLVFDNLRTLHGRTAFDASSGRVLSGCYGRVEDFESACRASYRALLA